MKPELRRVGKSQSPIVVIDDFSGDCDAIAAIADALAPFPMLKGNYYPGVRRSITREDAVADAYIERTCRDAAQFIAGAFDIEFFDLLESSFSIVSRDRTSSAQSNARRISIRPIRITSLCCIICACHPAPARLSTASDRPGSNA